MSSKPGCFQKVLVTGARGFIGKNLETTLRRREDIELHTIDIDSTPGDLDRLASHVDVVYHLAGVNRPSNPIEFTEGNAKLTKQLCESLKRGGQKATLVLSSSIQASLDNPYGQSKKEAEDSVFAYSAETGAAVYNFRLPNVFGKWCRPNYNSAVATFCYNIARGLPVQVHDPARVVELVYIDDVVRAFVGILYGKVPVCEGAFYTIQPSYKISVGEVVEMIDSFANARQSLCLPDMADPLSRALYATYQSYLPGDRFDYCLQKHEDMRGMLAELLKSPHIGQIFVSTTRPGVIRGNHYHDTKVEKFVVICGDAVIRFEHILTGERIDVSLSGREMKVVDIPPGYTHHIENTGKTELVVLFWASEIFNKDAPDTYWKEVRHG